MVATAASPIQDEKSAPAPTTPAVVAEAVAPPPPAPISTIPPEPKPDERTPSVLTPHTPGFNGALAYVSGVVAFLTFWVAQLFLPILLGVGAIVMGLLGRHKNPQDRRFIPAIALGGLAIVASVVFLALA